MTPTPSSPTPRRRRRLRRAKVYLSVLMLIGAAAYFGYSSTWASFTAQVSNPGNALGSGTLTMSDTVGSNTCSSYSANSDNNNNNGCLNTRLFQISNAEPGSYNTTSVTIANTGSLAASKFYVSAAPTNGVLTGSTVTLSAGTNVPYTLTVNNGLTGSTGSNTGLEGSIASGDTIVLSDGSTTSGTSVGTSACTATAAVVPTPTGAATSSPNPTSIPIKCTFPTGTSESFPAGSIVTDASSDASASNLDCYDLETTTGQTTGSTYGSELNFVSTTGNPLCSTAILFVQEQDAGGYNYCWAGNGVGTATCTTPTSDTLSSTISSGSAPTTIALGSALTGNIAGNTTGTGDTLTVTNSGGSTQYFTATGNSYIGGTSVSVEPALSTATAITSIPVASLSGTITSGQTVTLTYGSHTQNYQASSTVSGGATSIPVTAVGGGSITPSYAFPSVYTTVSDATSGASTTVATTVNATYASGLTITDQTATNAVNSDSTDTIANFDTGHGPSNLIQLYPLTANGTANTAATTELPATGSANSSRTFVIGLYIPNSPGQNQNNIQGLQSTFGISWSLSQ